MIFTKNMNGTITASDIVKGQYVKIIFFIGDYTKKEMEGIFRDSYPDMERWA